MTERTELLARIQELLEAETELKRLVFELGDVGTPDDVPLLNRLSRSGDPILRAVAFIAIGKIGGEAGTKALLKGMEEPYIPARVSVIGTVGKLKRADLIPTLEKLLDDENMQVAESASGALRMIGTPEALTALKKWDERVERTGYYTERYRE